MASSTAGNPYLWCAPYISNLLTGSTYSTGGTTNNMSSTTSNTYATTSNMSNTYNTYTTTYPSSISNKLSQHILQNHNIHPTVQRTTSTMSNTAVKPMRIVKELGHGSYGKVYEVKDQQDERYAVKIIPNLNNGPPDILEASIMSTINHPNIAKAVSISLLLMELGYVVV